jgi:hypothetical protein
MLSYIKETKMIYFSAPFVAGGLNFTFIFNSEPVQSRTGWHRYPIFFAQEGLIDKQSTPM